MTYEHVEPSALTTPSVSALHCYMRRAALARPVVASSAAGVLEEGQGLGGYPTPLFCKLNGQRKPDNPQRERLVCFRCGGLGYINPVLFSECVPCPECAA
jgi:hypothetical protein